MRLSEIADIGSELQYIKIAAKSLWNVKVGEEHLILVSLKSLRKNLEGNMLAQETIPSLDRWIEKLEKYRDREAISKDDGEELWTVSRIWADRVISELDKTPVMRLDRSMTLNFELLQDGAKGFFPEDVWNELPDISRNDLDEAARCLLCGIPTASAMIALRATEDVLRDYYKRKTGRTPTRKGWKSIIDELLTEEKSGKMKYSVNKSLMGHLDYVRTNRNMIGHPEKVFSKREAEGLFYQVVGTITEVSRDMGKKKSRQSSRV